MSLSRKENHRLVDALPDRDARTVKQLIEFVVMRSQAHHESGNQHCVTLDEAVISSEDLQDLMTAEAREFLAHPLEKDDLTDDEKARSEEGWRAHLAGQTTSLDDLCSVVTPETTSA